MYQPTTNMAEQNLPNGLPGPPHLENKKQNILSQEKPHYQFNGVHSSHSSRSSSPSARMGQIPSSHLPPSRPIPQSQLPPSRSPVTAIAQNVAGLNFIQNTPNTNPKFTTSSPNLQNSANFGQNSAFSPIVPTVPKQQVAQPNTELENIPLTNTNSNTLENVKYQTNTVPISAQNSTVRNPTPVNSSQITNQQLQPFSQVSNQFSSSQAYQTFQNPPQQRPTNQIPPQAPLIRTQIPTTTVTSFPNVQIPSNQSPNQPSNLPQVPIMQHHRPIGPYNVYSNPPTNEGISNVQSFNLNPNAPPKILPLNNNQSSPVTVQAQFRPSSMSSPNLYQPQINRTNGPPTTQNLGSQKANLHSNRYPVPPASNTILPHQQANLQQQNFQGTPQQQQYQNRISQPLNVYQKQVYPAQPQTEHPPQPQLGNLTQPQNTYNTQHNQYQGVAQAGFSRYWGTESYDLLQNPNVLPTIKIEAPRISLGQELLDQANCSPDIFRCTMTKIPENNSLLQKSRLPLGVLIHPFRDLSHLPVIQCNVIVRCRACRTYINPFVFFVDSKRWKCNLCYRINELPEEFQYDPVSKTYGDPSRRPEIKSSTIEYIAPAEYMLRPPQPAVYLYLLDVSRLAIESGYLHSTCSILLEELKNLPGDARTQIGFLAFDSALHFYSLAEGLSQPHEMTILDIDDVFLPTPDNLLVNLKDRMELIKELLSQLPTRYNNTFDNNSALGAALQVGYKMMSATGGRVTVFQASLPNFGPGALTAREDASQRSSAEVTQLNPANDFYKRLALECSGQQVAVDLFIVNSTYVDIATISGISRFSGGCIYHFPLFKTSNTLQCENFEKCFRRYLVRKIGFEAVMRIRCTRGLSIHTFHGNFFVRSTDLLSLPNINPDAGFGMQVAIEENLSDVQTVCFQAALLYTSSKGERRIRVHTMCLPIASTLQDIIHSADQQCIIGLLSKMAVDRSMQSSLSDAREAFINVAIDILSSYKLSLNLGSSTSGLLAPNCLKVLPLYISALLKHIAFRIGTSTRLDDRVKAMIDMKTKPLYQLIQMIYPDLYAIHNLENQEVILNSEEEPVSMPRRLQLSARCLENTGVPSYDAISDQMYEIPVLDNLRNQRLCQFINYLNEDKPFTATVQVIRDNSPNRVVFLERLIEDRVENALSYHEFLQHLKTQVK
ncbi:hypothetical protein NQ314_003269 [Rhamnusium bicolor]|uniref:Protein transport protein Sec24B n=1 Tax=Rhamnusium bicolor TaxID=1586634 RepID=A0AAV8ZP48_9CUCU|nr:hypothetical protein NQ314_003269 [Rhamnusium bicolor]